ncbi:nitrate reductase subunit beta [Salmonella enterica subsp. enterica serovar Saintpaul]|nr:nitrate reductase subunit beta [Salmonella enterica subsp. enterica serovar Saintpaul]
MKIRSQVGMVLNLDKCIGCHTCSVTCKNVWTSREGMEYAWFNNVESKPGVGFPNDWENQEKWKGGWIRKINGKLQPRMGNRALLLGKIFANPHLPGIDDYYEPFDYDYQNLHTAPESKHQPIARPRSLITGQRMDKITSGPNWEEILGGEFEKRAKDQNFENMQKAMYGQFENTFMMYLPRLCEHCLNPACVATCPSGAIYKREEDGIVLIDQDKCRGWRMCITGCPYKKIYFNWKSGKSEKCIFCYPRIEAGQPTVCSETCVGRIRYLGVLLYDADAIESAASTENEKDLYQRQLDVFLDPNDPAVIEQALKDGVPQSVIDAAQQSPVYKMAIDWKLALPLYLEYLAQLPKSEALGGLQDIAPILALLSARLQQRDSRYAVLFDLLLKLANTVIDSDKVAEKIANEARDDTPQALDAVWEEEQVKFFADQGCGESEISAHQRRFAGAVAPQYLNITTGGQH